MASVISSSFVVEQPQIDGRVWVAESHTFDDGTSQTFQYLADPDLDFQAIANERASAINAEIVAAAVRVPTSISIVQARRVINAYGLRVAVEAAVAAAPVDVQNIWYDTATVERDNPILLSLSVAMGLTSEQVDQMFRDGSKM